MEVKLKSLKLTNFKGAKSLFIEFNENGITNISGDNGTYKSTIFDAFTWLLFGKNSNDEKDFGVKTIDSENRVIEKLEHEVEGALIIDDAPVTFKRCLREKWQKPRGQENAVMTGNETLFFYNDVPLQAKEYADKISGIVNEAMFKLLTSTTYFNSLHWEKKRSCLIQLAGEIDPMEIIQNRKDFLSVVAQMEEQKITMDQLKSSIATKKKKFKDELDLIPARVDETTRATPESPDYAAVNARIAVLDEEILEIEKNITDATKIPQDVLDEKEKKQKEIHALQTRLNEIEQAEKIRIQNLKNERDTEANRLKNLETQKQNSIKEKQKTLDTIATRKRNNDLKIAALNKQIEALTEKYSTVSGEQLKFEDNISICPLIKDTGCAAFLESVGEKKKSMEGDFNTTKVSKLEEINREGKATKKQIADLHAANIDDEVEAGNIQLEIDELKKPVSVAEEQPPLPTLEAYLLGNAEYQKGKHKIEALKINTDPPKADTTAFVTKKNELIKLRDAEKEKLALKKVIDTNTARIKELKEREKFLGQEISNYEGTEFTIDAYNKAKSNIITERVNKMFSFVQFKLFNTLINGNEEPACDVLINGVPISDANTGSKINAGLDIIRVLNKFYNIYCPVFLDNAEVISKPFDLQCQLIKLTKVEGLSELKVEYV